jgi:hypothetical protein
VFIRSVYRLAELHDGFHSPAANNEAAFIALEGPLIILACIFLAIFHLGVVHVPKTAESSLNSERAEAGSQVGSQEV